MIFVKKIQPAQWTLLSEDAHISCFNEIKPATVDRIDFALLCVNGTDTPMAYVTCRELDHETLYWQFGGTFPGTRDTMKSWECYKKLTSWVKENGYKRITTLIENTNIVMLKFAMKMGYLICGIRNFKNTILIEHILEFNGG